MSIRDRVLDRLRQTPDDVQEMGEVFYYVGGRSWPAFCREIYRMQAANEVELDHVSHEENYIGLGEYAASRDRAST